MTSNKVYILVSAKNISECYIRKKCQEKKYPHEIKPVRTNVGGNKAQYNNTINKISQYKNVQVNLRKKKIFNKKNIVTTLSYR